MKQYSYKQCKAILNKAHFPLGLSFKEQFFVHLWAVFNKPKFYCFMHHVDNRYTLPTAYSIADSLMPDTNFKIKRNKK